MRSSWKLLRAFLELFVFYSALSWAYFYFNVPDDEIDIAVDTIIRMYQLLGLTTVAVVVLGVGHIYLTRLGKLAALASHEVNGIQCSIGPVPGDWAPPPRAKKAPDWASLNLPPDEVDGSGYINPLWMPKWEAQYGARFPAHVRLMRAVALTMNARPGLPAMCDRVVGQLRPRHDDDLEEPRSRDHGGHTLVEHSYLCGSIGVAVATKGFSYTGYAVKRRGDVGARATIRLKDPDYTFDAEDPLIGVICFAHDLGKVATFIETADGLIERGNRAAHDSMGPRLLAKMPEYWELPPEDRQVIQTVISHYHRPSPMPLARGRDGSLEAISDRTMALLSLVIRCDRIAGALENRERVLAERAPTSREDRVWDAFVSVILEHGRVCDRVTERRVGQKNVIDGAAVLTLRADLVASAVVDRLREWGYGEPPTHRAGVAPVTAEILELLENKGMRIDCGQRQAGTKFSPLCDVAFLGRDGRRKGEPIAKWIGCYQVRALPPFDQLAVLADAGSTPMVAQGRDGRQAELPRDLLDESAEQEQPWVKRVPAVRQPTLPQPVRRALNEIRVASGAGRVQPERETTSHSSFRLTTLHEAGVDLSWVNDRERLDSLTTPFGKEDGPLSVSQDDQSVWWVTITRNLASKSL
jgi:hypothetical protein